MATFYNQARLTLDGRAVSSNQTEGEIVSRVTLTKIPLSTDYGPGDNIVYAIQLTNGDTVDKQNITITDNLGEFTPPGLEAVVPLNYVPDSVRYFVNGVLATTPDVNAGTNLVISGINIPAGGNVLIIYEVQANEYAPMGENASITNRVEANGGTLCEELADTANVPTRNEPILSIAKAVCPETVSCGDPITYTFIIQNTGNVPVVATDNLIVSDIFVPPLTDITVTLNGEELTENIGYSYNELTGEFTTLDGAIPVPAATFTRDSETGIININPGVAVLTVTGQI